MEPYIFDPDGDVTLILNRCLQTNTSPMSHFTIPAIKPNTDELLSNQIKMLVSSKHMILSSSVFAGMLSPSFNEGSMLRSIGKVEISLPDDNPEIFAILLYIIHGRTKKVPRRLELAQLVIVAIIVDKYQMQEVVGFYYEIWLNALKDGISEGLTKNNISWLCISWVFGDRITFQKVTEGLIRNGDTEINKYMVNELPIPEKVIERIQYMRHEGAIGSLILKIHELLKNSQTSDIACKRTDGMKSACDAMILGSILQGVQSAGLWPFPDPPYEGFTFGGLKESILAIEIKTLCDCLEPGDNGYENHAGRLTTQRGQRKHSPFGDSNSLFLPGQDYGPFGDQGYGPFGTKPKKTVKNENTASEKIKNVIAKDINFLSDSLTGLKIEDFL